MSGSWEPEFTLPDEAVLEGFANHAEPHRNEVALDLEDFLQEATNVMNAPDVVVSFDQNGSTNTLYGSEDLGRVVYQNAATPEKSTTFIPSGSDGVAGYVDRTVGNKANSSPEFLLNDLSVNPEIDETGDAVSASASLVETPAAIDNIEAVTESMDATESDWL